MRHALLVLPLLLAADWPQYRGPDRSGSSPEKGLLKAWPKAGPKLLWKSKEAGNGLSGLSIVGGITYTLGEIDGQEYGIALDKAGKLLWKTKLGPTHDFEGNNWSRGPNSSPTIKGKHGWFVTSNGVLACLELEKGAEVWKIDMRKEMKGEVSPKGWPAIVAKIGSGYCWSPVLVGEDKLLIAPGGPDGLLALIDAKTKKELWRTTKIKDQATYGTPGIGKIGDKEMAFYVTQDSFHVVDLKDGATVFTQKYPADFNDIVCSAPTLVGKVVHFSVGNGGGSFGYEWDGKTFKEKWAEKEIGSRLGGTCILDGHHFGYHEDSSWMCQEVETGKLTWKRARQKIKAGAAIAADGLLFVATEDNSAVLMQGTAKDGFKVLGEVAFPEKPERAANKPSMKTWTGPSLSDGKLYLRDQQWVFCYEVGGK